MNLTPLTSLDQLQVGTRLKIISRTGTNNYKSISVKKLIKMWNEHGDGSIHGKQDTEILINKKKNYYFSMNAFLDKQSWAVEVYVVPGIDKRLKYVKATNKPQPMPVMT